MSKLTAEEQKHEEQKVKVDSKLGGEIYNALLKLNMDKKWSYWDLTAELYDLVKAGEEAHTATLLQRVEENAQIIYMTGYNDANEDALKYIKSKK